MIAAPPAKVVAGFFSFTEVEAGEHQSYNEWHLNDHMPEQFVIPGIAWGQRWRVSGGPVDRIHYVTLYLFAEPLAESLDQFRALARRLHGEGRFHEHRTAHRSGPLRVDAMAAARRVLVSPEAVPYRPAMGMHIHVSSDGGGSPAGLADLVDVPGVAGVWAFAGDVAWSGSTMTGLRVTCCWLDGEPESAGAALADRLPSDPVFAATLATVDPRGPWDWFDHDR